MILYKVRIYNASTGKEIVTSMTLEDIISDPFGVNMADVGLILLNKERILKNLEPIPESYVSGSIEDLRIRGNL
jgi:hypothetical protein